jgi:GrpB-like predicted nucleotidyltransferase (UPF0157 family)
MPGESNDPVAAWARLRELKGRRATVIDLYRLAAEPFGLQPHELPQAQRLALARSVMPIVWPGWEITDGSERRDPIIVVDYDPTWPDRFRRWHDRIARALGPVAHRIEHVGSTSVPDLAAKPIVDIQIGVVDMTAEDTFVPALEHDVGVQLRSRDSLHRYFRPFSGTLREVHVHVCEIGSPWEREHLLFRDYLRVHDDAAHVYAQAKRDAAARWADDGWAYTDAKSEAILDILEKAEAWATTSGWRLGATAGPPAL